MAAADAPSDRALLPVHENTYGERLRRAGLYWDTKGCQTKPEIFAIIEFGPNATGFLHKLGEVEPEQVKMNMEVEAVLKPKRERQGKINDIAYFRPI